MYCEEFNVAENKLIVDFVDENELQIKERIDHFESIFSNEQLVQHH